MKLATTDIYTKGCIMHEVIFTTTRKILRRYVLTCTCLSMNATACSLDLYHVECDMWHDFYVEMTTVIIQTGS